MRSARISDPKTFNRYSYVSNNPLNLTDPTGEQQQQCPEGQKCDQDGNIIVGVVGSVTVTSSTPVTTTIPDNTPIYERSWLSRFGSWLWRGTKTVGRGIGQGALKVGGAVAIIVTNPTTAGCGASPGMVSNGNGQCVPGPTMSDEPDADTSANPDPEDNKPDADPGQSGGSGSNKGNKGTEFRGGKKKSRDRDYGIKDKDFWNWWHREGKREYGGTDIMDSKDANDIYDDWVDRGKPKRK